MLYFFTIIISLLLVTGQSLWKVAASNFLSSSGNAVSFTRIIKTLISSQFLIGAIFYVIATLLYLWLFSRHPFYAVQIILVSFSIVLSLLASHFIFKESVNFINYWGIALIIIGAFLVTWKS